MTKSPFATEVAAVLSCIKDVTSLIDNVDARLHEIRNAKSGDEARMELALRTYEAERVVYCGALTAAYARLSILNRGEDARIMAAWTDEDRRAEALAEQAQHEDDLKAEILDRAAAEWDRKNPNAKAEAWEWAEMCAERDLSAKALSDRELFIEMHDRMEYELDKQT